LQDPPEFTQILFENLPSGNPGPWQTLFMPTPVSSFYGGQFWTKKNFPPKLTGQLFFHDNRGRSP
jgi:hypothetical protein